MDKLSNVVSSIQTLKLLLEKQSKITDYAQFICITFRKLSQNTLAYTPVRQKKIYEQEQDSFQPQICEKSQMMAESMQKRNGRVYENLYSKRNQNESKIKIQREIQAEQEIAPCTFHPQTNYNSQLLSQQHKEGKSCYERLYSKRNAPKTVQDIRRTEEKDLEKCTFQPEINQSKQVRQFGPAKGFEETIARMKKAQTMKQEKKQIAEKIPVGENYEKLRKQGIQPFNLTGKPEKKKILLFVDVNIGPGKTGRIGVHEDDNLEKLANNFARTYQLNSEQRQQLQELLSSQLQNYLHTL